MLGSLHDAEDLVQETLLRAWRGLETFKGRGSFRAWLYKIATNACLDALARRPRRILPTEFGPPSDPQAQAEPPVTEGIWLEPYPDLPLRDVLASPESLYDARESISLAFVAAIQHIPARHRAVLILRDVLGLSAGETAALLETTAASVNSTLQRARTTIRRRLPSDARESTTLPHVLGDLERALVDKYIRAWEAADVHALVALLKEDARMSMPPTPSWYLGRASIAAFFAALFESELGQRLHLFPARANCQPAVAVYVRDPQTGRSGPFAMMVLTLDARFIAEITGFVDPTLFPAFGLPTSLEQ
jgi:RNA polymerase sigma-70 factor (ECF subfamily)